jgi:hypothetical protein
MDKKSGRENREAVEVSFPRQEKISLPLRRRIDHEGEAP